MLFIGLHYMMKNFSVNWLDDKTLAEMESIKQLKVEQLKAYKEECSVRFPC